MSQPIITPAEMRAAEQALFETGVDSFEIMKRAGEAVADALHDAFHHGKVQVLCGPGGNGGDGFIAAAALKARWRDVEVFCSLPVSKLEGDAARACALWEGKVGTLKEALESPADVTLDALFGGGLSRPMRGNTAKLAERPGPVVSVDVPSGIDGLTGAAMGPSFKAALTVTFSALRPAHVLQPGSSRCGGVVVADIGVPVETLLRHNSPQLWAASMPRPDAGLHKHKRGHLMVMSGGASSTGAARLSAMAGLRAGAGLVTLLSPPSAVMVNAAHLTAIMLRAVADAEAVGAETRRASATLIGPAAGVDDHTVANVEAMLAGVAPCLLDADALTVFQARPDDLLRQLQPRDVLTPHVGEFKRIFDGVLEGTVNKVEAVRAAAAAADCVVLLKGADTVIARPDGIAVVNTHATPWLATAGSGDVLGGIIAGLIAQGMDSFDAACMGAWVHGEAGRRVGAGLIAEDLPRLLPDILSLLHGELA